MKIIIESNLASHIKYFSKIFFLKLSTGISNVSLNHFWRSKASNIQFKYILRTVTNMNLKIPCDSNSLAF